MLFLRRGLICRPFAGALILLTSCSHSNNAVSQDPPDGGQAGANGIPDSGQTDGPPPNDGNLLESGTHGRQTFCDLSASPAFGLTVPEGFCIREYTSPAVKITEARVLRFSPSGDLFVTAPSSSTPGGAYKGPGAILVLPDDNHDGRADIALSYAGAPAESHGSGSCGPDESTDPASFACVHGLLFANNYLYYTRTNEIRRFAYTPHDRKAPVSAGELVATLGTASIADARWTHTLDQGPDGTMYVSRGRFDSSSCTASAMTEGAVLSFSIASQQALPVTLSPFADGFRNPMYLRCQRRKGGLCFANELSGDDWTGVGGREKLALLYGGGHWGYPCCVGPRMPAPSAISAGVNPCQNVGAEQVPIELHDTPFGLDFESGAFPAPYGNSIFIALHGAVGSWIGTAVVYIPTNPTTGLPLTGATPAKFITGWANSNLQQGVHGRATDVAFAPDGRLFIADDTSGGIWWVAPVNLKLPPGW